MKIENVFPHPSEDDLDIVTLGPGIKCVVHKGQFKTGETVKFVPVKTVKKGIICHGMIVHEDNYVEFNTEATLIIQPGVHDNPIPDKHYDGGLRELLEKPLSMAEVFSGGEDIIERIHETSPLIDPDALEDLNPDYHGDPNLISSDQFLDEIEEDVNN